MSKGSSSSITGFVVVFFAFLAFSMLSHGIGNLLVGLGVPRSVVGPGLLLLLLWFLLSWMKRVLLRSGAEEIALVPANPMDYQWLNQQELGQLTDILEASYFVHLKDFTVHAKDGRLPETFARIFHNPNLHCYAEVNQVHSALTEGLSLTVSSRLDDGWSLSTTTRVPFAGLWVLRKPKAVWTSHPTMTPEQLLQSHLSWRENMVCRLGCKPVTDTSFEAYEQKELDMHNLNRQLVRRKSMLMILIDQLIFSMSPKMQWMGDYPRAAAQMAKKRGR